MNVSSHSETLPNFGEFLAYLRKRARLTQGELGRAVGYSREQITRLENNHRAPDPAVIAARFVPALGLELEGDLATRLLELARAAAFEASRKNETVTRVNNLPAPLLPLIGRERDVDTLTQRILGGNARLITLTGPAGVGKTRLALHLARETQEHFREGVCFVSLAPIFDPARVPEAILHALGLDATITSEPRALLKAHLRAKHIFFILDNFEQILDAALFVSELLTDAAHIKILVTSRAPLGLYGEYQFPLAPLPLPALHTPLSTLHTHPAIALFVQRAQQVAPGFQLTAENAGEVAALCAQLDGLPLALELAAAQLKLFSLEELRAGLEHNAIHFEFPARNVPERHHSLSNALAWSYAHLAPNAQRVFQWLGVFSGGATAAMLRALKLGANVQEMLNALVEMNLAQAQSVPTETRYTLFETVRQFAREQLALNAGEGLAAQRALERAERRHARYFLDFAERAEPHLTSAAQSLWLERLECERDNVRRALAWTLEHAEPNLALRLCNALWKFWRYRCELAEGYEWTARALELANRGSAALELRAEAEWGAGLLAAVMQREEDATAHLEASLRLWEIVEDDRGVAGALTALGARKMYQRKFSEAMDLQRQAIELCAHLNDSAALAYAHNALGETLRAAGDYAASRAEYIASLESARAAGHARSIAVARANLASVELALGNPEAAREHIAASLPTFIELNDRVNVASCVAELGCVNAREKEFARATELFGLAHALLDEAGGKFEAADQLEISTRLQECRAALGANAFERAWNQGAASSLEQVLVLVEMHKEAK